MNDLNRDKIIMICTQSRFKIDFFLTLGRPRKNVITSEKEHLQASGLPDRIENESNGTKVAANPKDDEPRQLKDVLVGEDAAKQKCGKVPDLADKQNSNQQIQSKSEELESSSTPNAKLVNLNNSNQTESSPQLVHDESRTTISDLLKQGSSSEIKDSRVAVANQSSCAKDNLSSSIETSGLHQPGLVQNDFKAKILGPNDDDEDFSLYLSDSDENDEQSKSADLKEETSVTSVFVAVENLKVEIDHNNMSIEAPHISPNSSQICEQNFADSEFNTQQTNRTVKIEGTSNYGNLGNVETENLISPTSAAKSAKRDRLVQNEVAKQKYNFRSKLTIPRKYLSDDEDEGDKVESKIIKPEKLLKIAQPLTTTTTTTEQKQQLNALDLDAEDYEELEIISSETEVEEHSGPDDKTTSTSHQINKEKSIYNCEKDISGEKIILKIKKKKKKKHHKKEESIRMKKKKGSKHRHKNHSKDRVKSNLPRPSTSSKADDDLR
jgi:hypothetical protein